MNTKDEAPETVPTSDRISEIRARLDAATPGPWHLDDMSELRDAEDRPLVRGYEGEGGAHAFWEQPANRDSDADAQLVVHAPDDLAWLLDVVDRVRALHRPYVMKVSGQTTCEGCHNPWPCSTARALGVES